MAAERYGVLGDEECSLNSMMEWYLKKEVCKLIFHK